MALAAVQFLVVALEGVCLVECGQLLGSGAVLEGVEEVLGTQVPGVPVRGEIAIRIRGICLESRLGCPTPAAA